jgi:hypothetical protein
MGRLTVLPPLLLSIAVAAREQLDGNVMGNSSQD